MYLTYLVFPQLLNHSVDSNFIDRSLESYYHLFLFILVSLLLVILIGLISIWLTCRRYHPALQKPPPPQSVSDVLVEIILPLLGITVNVCGIIIMIWLLLLQGVQICRVGETLLFHIAGIAVLLTWLYLPPPPPQTVNALNLILAALMIVWGLRLLIIYDWQGY